ncbi:hypothetical protein BOTBODRAFT_29895 [Botryobasidium botryosum FD-172 SS1]|uniref:Protein prenylyltransferase n=1 Tax=Botryobasidium botryosum (strain FD-172 SS1) TaxID=930990 RepID=A0A067MQ85_BOTB1|nr:hypothetical protein BOTBODRAFT_29895 [Botryobasidium botryosum FD-172 SS1]
MLVTRLSPAPTAIEIIPGDGSEWISQNSDSISPFLFIDAHLGVPQKALRKAYIEAMAVFHRASERRKRGDTSDENDALVAASTSVILLANPDHNTALNRRKELVLRGALRAPEELDLCAAILSEARNSKASLLWHHRRWLLQYMYPPGVDIAEEVRQAERLESAAPADALAREFDIVEKAAEAYPRNYHAWAHRYACLRCLVMSARTARPGAFVDLLVKERERMEVWVDRHVGDHTAMQYLCHVIEGMWEIGLEERNLPRRCDSRTLAHAFAMVRSYPEHEAVWAYLREVCLLVQRWCREGSFWEDARALSALLVAKGEPTQDEEEGRGEDGAVRIRTARDAAREQSQKAAILARKFSIWSNIMDGTITVNAQLLSQLRRESAGASAA